MLFHLRSSLILLPASDHNIVVHCQVCIPGMRKVVASLFLE